MAVDRLTCAGYVAHPFSKETVFTLAFHRCDLSFAVFFPGARSLQEGHGFLNHDGFSVCSPSAICPLPRCDRLHPLCRYVSGRRCSAVLVAQLEISICEPGRKHAVHPYHDLSYL